MTEKMKDGVLRGEVPEGSWQVIRFGCGTTGAKVSTSSPGWSGLALDYLGEMKNLAEVRLNGKSLGVIWAKPFAVELTGTLRAGGNALEIDVTNFWPNRIIGDSTLPVGKRITRTTVRMDVKTPLLESGLLGPVMLRSEDDKETRLR